MDHQQPKLSKVKLCVRGDYCADSPRLTMVPFTMVQKQHTFGRKRTLNFDLLPGGDVGGVLSGDAGQAAAAPAQPRGHRGRPPTL